MMFLVSASVEGCPGSYAAGAGAVSGQGFLRYYGIAVFEQDDTIANQVLAALPQMQKLYNDQTGYHLAIFHLEQATAEFRNQLQIEKSYAFD